jgi:hypothetical protein
MRSDLHYSERDDQVFPELFREKTAKPAVGAFVRLTIDNWRSPSLLKHNYFRIMGKVVPLPAEAEADAFAVWVEGDMVPLRVVLLRDVHSINGERVRSVGAPKPLPKAEVTRTFLVTGSKGDKYEVETVNGNWTCTCKGFGFRHQCRHINEAAARLAALQR